MNDAPFFSEISLLAGTTLAAVVSCFLTCLLAKNLISAHRILHRLELLCPAAGSRSADESSREVRSMRAGRDGDGRRRISIATQDELLFCALRDIMWMEAAGSYCRVYLSDGQKLLVSKTLSAMEERLGGNTGFMRIHKSHLVQLRYIVRYRKGDGGLVTLSEGTQLAVSRKAKEELLSKLENGV